MYYLFRAIRSRNNMPASVMSLEESRRTQRPYRYGMILLCVGALINWLGLAENYSEPIRYAGVTCILAGALLICTAMCCWLHTPNRNGTANEETNDPIHVISSAEMRNRSEKPPDYDSVAVAPPSYDDAIKLNPSVLLTLQLVNQSERPTTLDIPHCTSSSCEPESSECDQLKKESPPPYEETKTPCSSHVVIQIADNQSPR